MAAHDSMSTLGSKDIVYVTITPTPSLFAKLTPDVRPRMVRGAAVTILGEPVNWSMFGCTPYECNKARFPYMHCNIV